jgi:hypothetical protein
MMAVHSANKWYQIFKKTCSANQTAAYHQTEDSNSKNNNFVTNFVDVENIDRYFLNGGIKSVTLSFSI